jgi:hypothetical protein
VTYALNVPTARWVIRDRAGDPGIDLSDAPRPSPGTGAVQVTQTRGTELWAAVILRNGRTPSAETAAPAARSAARPSDGHICKEVETLCGIGRAPRRCDG